RLRLPCCRAAARDRALPRDRSRNLGARLALLTVGVLRQANFRLLFAARTVSFFGSNLVPIAVAFAVLDMTGSATDVGLSFAARTLAQIATLLVGGLIADRLPPRRVMVGSETASLLVQVALAVLRLPDNGAMWELVAL